MTSIFKKITLLFTVVTGVSGFAAPRLRTYPIAESSQVIGGSMKLARARSGAVHLFYMSASPGRGTVLHGWDLATRNEFLRRPVLEGFIGEGCYMRREFMGIRYDDNDDPVAMLRWSGAEKGWVACPMQEVNLIRGDERVIADDTLGHQYFAAHYKGLANVANDPTLAPWTYIDVSRFRSGDTTVVWDGDSRSIPLTIVRSPARGVELRLGQGPVINPGEATYISRTLIRVAGRTFLEVAIDEDTAFVDIENGEKFATRSIEGSFSVPRAVSETLVVGKKTNIYDYLRQFYVVGPALGVRLIKNTDFGAEHLPLMTVPVGGQYLLTGAPAGPRFGRGRREICASRIDEATLTPIRVDCLENAHLVPRSDLGDYPHFPFGDERHVRDGSAVVLISTQDSDGVYRTRWTLLTVENSTP